MGRIVLLASVLVAILAGEVAAEPLRGARAPERGPGPRHEPVLRVGSVQLDLEALRDEALARLKEGVAEAIEARSDELRTAFGAEADAWAQTLYKDFLHWLNERARAELLRRHPHLRDATLPEERFVEWLDAPDRELRLYVDLYFAERAPALKWLLDAWCDEASWELADGLKELLADAQDKLVRFTRTADDVAREPDAPLAEMLRRHGLSGEWMDGFEAHEDRLRALDGPYRVVDATRLVIDAFQSHAPRQKLDRLLDLMSLLGDAAGDSAVPVAAFFGQVVQAYADVARELLGQLDRLSAQLRKRAGYCVGAGATGDQRHRAFVRQFGSRDQACPTRIADVYERTLPADGRIYFWVGDRFRAGREGNGEFPAVVAARALMREAVADGDPTWVGRESDLAALADTYDVGYASERFGRGVPGLRREAEDTIAGISRRLAELERGLGADCTRDALRRGIERETGLRAGEGQDPVAGNGRRLALRYAIGYLRGGGAWATWSQIGAALRELSLLRVSGRVVAADGGATGVAALRASWLALQPLAGCAPTHADAGGRFAFHALGRAAEFRLRLGASAPGRESPVSEVTPAAVGVDRTPFVAALDGLTLELPAGPATVAPTPGPSGGSAALPRATPDRPTRDRREGVDTSNPGPDAEPALRPEPRLPAPDVRGLGVDEAERRLAAAGYAAELVGGDPAPDRAREFSIQEQYPHVDGRVRLRVHSGFEPPRPVPSVLGMSVDEAERRLREAGFAPEVQGGDPAPRREAAFAVQAQEPAPRSLLAAGGRVRLRVHSAFVEPRPVATPLPTPAPVRTAATPRPVAPPPRPTPAPGPVDNRLPCTCRDAAGKPFRMLFDQACDATSWGRTDDCRP